jgi:hypothetical protein
MEIKQLKTKDKTVIFYLTLNGKNIFHNWDGAAYIPEGNMRKAEYYLFGIKYTKDEWLEKKADVNGVPFFKTAAGKQAESRV